VKLGPGNLLCLNLTWSVRRSACEQQVLVVGNCVVVKRLAFPACSTGGIQS